MPGLGSLAVVVGVCFGVGYTASHLEVAQSTSSSATLGTSSLHILEPRSRYLGDNELSVTVVNEYSSASRVDPAYFGAHEIVEPHRVSTLSAHDRGYDVGIQSDNGGPIDYVWLVDGEQVGRGVTCEHTFTRIGYTALNVHRVHPSAQGEGAQVLASEGVTVLVKYVRRELRSLSEDDRNDFFDTTQVLYQVSQNEGESLYGKAYKDKDFFARLHLKYAGALDCDHWHDGLGFMISHTALTMQFEQSLQAVAPHVTVPYWDFTLDSTFYTEDTWRESQVFDAQWFGDAAPRNELHTVTEGRWAYMAVRVNAWQYSEITNSYGLLRAPWNNDPVPFVTRSDMIAGYKNNLKPRGCSGFSKCLSYNSWSSLAQCLNTDAHGHIHELVGGSFDGAWVTDTESNSSLLSIGEHLFDEPYNLLHLALFMSKNLWRDGIMACPEYCSMDSADGTDCACSCDAKQLESETAYETLERAGVLGRAAFFDHQSEHIELVMSKGTGKQVYNLKNMPQHEQDHVWESLRENLCSVGKIGDMYSASSPSDVTFWVMHPTIERLWHWIRLSSNETTFDDSWPVENDCAGHNGDDVQPFTGELFDDPQRGYLTNAELYELMHPLTGSLEYIYDSYQWPHCIKRGYTMEFTGTENDYSADSFFA